ncbi:unnamed protein product [Euphydryas editha]|uniref:Uncharacterized protein n=1 Tax=Euphydryas editha TaxID=104508 RepID=A0AAU9T962_EUPED|nr:unnamed protein product [Euphydryas editha]
MNEDRFDKRCKNNQNRYICSICLNQKPLRDDKNIECDKRKSKSCPICQKNCNYEYDCAVQNDYKSNERDDKQEKYGKIVQTSQADVTQGMSLLNEVLTVFQSKKQSEIKKDKCKTIIMKDASVNTEDCKKDFSKLTVSDVFYFTIEKNNETHDSKFEILNCRPETTKVSQFSIDLMHRKSSSIPQMKLEELKKSLKEKNKSKDAIEEVNRMFATVRKCEVNEKFGTPNRPMIRSGPRVLPVVKTPNENADAKNKPANNCRYCQTNYKMSSGDTFEYNHRTNDKCENCFYMMCCHYHHSLHSGAACPHCCKDCEHNKSTDVNV